MRITIDWIVDSFNPPSIRGSKYPWLNDEFIHTCEEFIKGERLIDLFEVSSDDRP